MNNELGNTKVIPTDVPCMKNENDIVWVAVFKLPSQENRRVLIRLDEMDHEAASLVATDILVGKTRWYRLPGIGTEGYVDEVHCWTKKAFLDAMKSVGQDVPDRTVN